MSSTVERISSLAVLANKSLDEHRYYDLYICMLEREKQIQLLFQEPPLGHDELHAMLTDTQTILQRLEPELKLYQAALDHLVPKLRARAAYAHFAGN